MLSYVSIRCVAILLLLRLCLENKLLICKISASVHFLVEQSSVAHIFIG